MKENHARMNFPLSLFTEGAPVYEQKEPRKQRRALKARFPLKGRCAVRMARAERTADFTNKKIGSGTPSHRNRLKRGGCGYIRFLRFITA